MGSIKFDSTEILNTTYVPRFVKHESTADREIVTLPITRSNGSVKISARYAEKIITIQGILIGTSAADLESKIDAFKELFSRQDKNLDIDWNGSTRRYVATCKRHDFDRDHFNISYVPWSAEFLVPLGIGTDSSETSIYDSSGIGATASTTLTFAGSAQPRPIFTIDMTTAGSAQVIQLLNNDTGQFIKIDGPYANSDQIIVDCLAMTVKKNGTSINFRGLFPNFYIGANSFTINIIGAGSNADQAELTGAVSGAIIYDDGSFLPWEAQSFIPSESGYVDKIDLVLAKTGAPTGNFDVLLYSDENNKPSINLTSGNPGYRIAASSVTTLNLYNLAWVSGTRPFLTAGVKYWIVNNPATLTSTSSIKYITWQADVLSAYPTGKAMFRKGSTGTWRNGLASPVLTPDYGLPGDYVMTFRTYMGSGGSVTSSVRLRVKYTKQWL